MDLGHYIDALAEFGPQLLQLGYELGDFNDRLPVIHVRGNGIETYVWAADREQLDSLVDPELHAERLAVRGSPPESS